MIPALLGAALLVWAAPAAGLGSVPAAALASVALLAGAGCLWLERRRAGQSEQRLLARLLQLTGQTSATRPAISTDEAIDRVASRLQALLDGARNTEGILDALDEPVLAVDGSGKVVVANRGAALFLAPGAGVTVTGRPLDELLPDEQVLSAVRGALQGRPGRGRVKLLTGEGPRIVEVAAEPIRRPGDRPDPPGAVVTLRDITEQATALQLKTDFVANASHELRTPLASIKTAAETLADLGDESPAMRARLVSMIASNAERLEELSRDLLDLSSLESPETECIIERVDVFEVADELRSLFETACAQRRVPLEFALDERLHAVWTDPRLLRLILRNLIDNAVKFAYEDTTVRVHGAARAAGPRLDARLEVIDQGIGIPLSMQARVFERFFQVDSARSGTSGRRGTGLGLAIVKHALRALGGTIQVRSVWQQGTTMTVDLPGCVEPAAVTAGSG